MTQEPGQTGQFDLLVDGEPLVRRGGDWLTRKPGAGYPGFAAVVATLEKRLA